MTRKVLVSPQFGAGWSTWSDSKYRDDMLFDPQLIADIENGRDRIEAAEEFVQRLEAKYSEEIHIYLGGARDLQVVEVDGPFMVEEYDGNESILRRDSGGWL
jgi:hypothetical protein